ncbi:amidohydrolase family protein [Ancylobacter pratisalsi]|uniref:Amidohydrolase family protein n=1 Tax=Ancylobacter pratisalsi TaxID=1745854 RepID=A0A6P1YQQ6_9HYPH|nr:amidohydrolase family protein [Ancylobacter pratisalsi]QIB35220.1 amidohydrolase family protein [Ancylobacter pratisalsi]
MDPAPGSPADGEVLAYDLIVEDVLILTGDAAMAEIRHGRLGVRGDRIALVGPASGPAPAAARTLDGRGLLAIPGLVNVHTHSVLSLMRGVAEDMGFAPAYTRGVPQGHLINPDEAVALARLGALESLKFGTTLINDMYVHVEHTLPAMAELGLRVFASDRLHDVDFTRVQQCDWRYDPAIGRRSLDAALALAERFDGAFDGRARVTLAAHAPDTCSRDFLREIRRARDATGLTVSTHLAQSPLEAEFIAHRDGMTPTELLDDVGLLDARLIAAHCIVMNDSDIARAGAAGITVAHVPKGNAGGGMMAPTRALREAGANLALATDNLLGDMIEAMRWALCIGRLQTGTVTPDWQPEDVFAMATGNGASALGLADEIGALTVGRKADIVLVDIDRPSFVPLLDPLGNLVHCGQGSHVRHVVIDGVLRVCEGRAVGIDEEDICRQAQRTAENLWQRAAA